MSSFLLLIILGFAALTGSSARIQKRVVNGDVAGYVQFPYMVSVRMAVSSFHNCGGSLVTPEHVVTAAHCVVNNDGTPALPETVFVVTGHLNNMDGGRVSRVSDVRNFPEYSPADSWRNDISVLKLATPVPFTATEQPIPIASADVGAQPCILSGWGRVFNPSRVLPSQLQMQVQNTMTRETCIQWWPEQIIYESTLCAGGSRGSGVCGGDSGGPLVCNGELAGVVSWGNACANGFPDAYVRVFAFREWLLESTADQSLLGKTYAAEALEARNTSK